MIYFFGEEQTVLSALLSAAVEFAVRLESNIDNDDNNNDIDANPLRSDTIYS